MPTVIRQIYMRGGREGDRSDFKAAIKFDEIFKIAYRVSMDYENKARK